MVCDDLTGSDSTHPTLYIEAKLRGRHTTRTLHDEVKRRSAKEGKTPVLALFDRSRPGFLVVVHSDDLAAVLVEYAFGLDEHEGHHLEDMIRQAGAAQPGTGVPGSQDLE
jgi:hypothetical protein